MKSELFNKRTAGIIFILAVLGTLSGSASGIVVLASFICFCVFIAGLYGVTTKKQLNMISLIVPLSDGEKLPKDELKRISLKMLKGGLLSLFVINAMYNFMLYA